MIYIRIHVILLVWCIPLLLIGAPTNGDLSIEMLCATNLAVDSNDPISGPRSAHIAVRVCNNGINDMSDVTIYAGDFMANPPGIYPSHTVSLPSYSGTFSPLKR